ncbi:hypothetical protein GCM10027162_07950 [Streptomyces incanus]
MRTFGLSCDSVRSLTIVTADGAVRTVSREEGPELFWAARGGLRGLRDMGPGRHRARRGRRERHRGSRLYDHHGMTTHFAVDTWEPS